MFGMRLISVAVLALAIGAAAHVEDAAALQEGAPVVKSGYVEVEGGRVFCEEAGEGTPVVLLHDGLLHRETWDDQFLALAGSHRVLRYDRRGYGLSPAPEVPFSQVGDLDAVLTAAGIERAVIAGCSSGGEFAIDYALAHPECVSGLLLVGPVVSGMGYTAHFTTRGGRFFPTEKTTIDEVIDYFTTVDPYGIASENQAARERANALLRANPQDLSWEGYRWARPPDRPALPNLGEIAVRTLIVVGEFDIPDVHAHAGAIEAGIPNATRLVVSHAGHLVHFEQPEAFNRIALEFLAKLAETGPR
jgi:pimeloyl-ACP methyl ester carboxylesterase